ncbi:MAG: hypothetical protein ACO1OX_01835 [Novosphingobium sp.]
MPQAKLSDRLHLQIEVALNQNCDCTMSLSSQERRADQLGLTRAEIDAARARRGFDVHTDAAIDFACAVAAHDQTRIFVASVKALAVGMTMDQLELVAALAMSKSKTATQH